MDDFLDDIPFMELEYKYYDTIETIAMGDERDLTLFVNRLVGNELKKEPEKKPKIYNFKSKSCAICGCDFVPRYGAQKRCNDCKEKGLKIKNHPEKKQNFRDKNCPVCKHDFTPRSAAQQRCDDCMKEGSKIQKGEKKSIKSPIQPPDRNCFGKQYEYGSAFCTGSCSVREKCRKAFEGGT